MTRYLPLVLLPFICAAAVFYPSSGAAARSVEVHEVAGQGVQRIPEGERVTVRGVVSAAYPGDSGLNGFFLQGRDPAPDGKPSGLFVYAPELEGGKAEAVEPGKLLELTGYTGMFHGRPQLEGLQKIRLLGDRRVEPYPVRMPLRDPRRLEGVLVRLEQELTVTDNRALAKYGSLELAAGGRAFRKTNFLPGEGPEDPSGRGGRIILDDGSYTGGPEPIPYLSGEKTRRVGARIEKGLVGIITRAFQQLRIHPAEQPRFERVNPRPGPLPEPDPDAVRVAVINADSYFLSLGERGARSRRQLRIQRSKLLALATGLKADLLVLLEMENRDGAAQDLVRRLRGESGNAWRLLRAGNPGDDAIRISLAYREDRVRPVAEAARDGRGVHTRPPLLAAFRPRGGGETFAVAAAHFKSKGNCPEGRDPEREGGCWNRLRTRQARALAGFIDSWREKNHVPVLVAGDLNAYGAEAPLGALRRAGFLDLLRKRVPWRDRYTYVYSGESGYLDHLLARPELAEAAKEVFTHAVNADEPPFLGYDQSGPAGRHYPDSPYRSSDHDPVAVDLGLR